ncbi:hypothetical protein SEA_JUMBO_85 [Gordonia phage Jumbo]|uniref:Uncharacterized protein n=1 Tax=Gordonia phage Jumbo TaxID=1887650 RepID=A0A1B3B0Q3_9CAUD|nr:hypothetical protein BIZ69_gp085 [Gordonia phage Jumbo]AOE44593.1 hypothetical protein SEA_JUMBO_85 [Gordonia phage Jumbo]
MNWKELLESLTMDHLDRFRFDNTICPPGLSRQEIIEQANDFCVSASSIIGEDAVKDMIERVR